MIRTLATAIILATPSAAQDVSFSDIHTVACLDEALEFAERRACIGASAAQCMKETEGGFSTYGESACVSKELDWWDVRLNTEYQKARARAREFDLDGMQTTNPQTVSDSLLAMQRAWIAFRDKKCGYERSLWGGGTGGGPATAWCLLYMTAEQAMYLETSGGG